MLALVALGILIGLASQYLMAGARRGLEIYQSGGMRSIYWPYAAKLIAQMPWTGWGYGSFESVFLHHYMADKALNPAMVQIEYNLDHPTTSFSTGRWRGPGPMLGMVLMGGALLWRLSRAGWVKGAALLALVTPILLHTQTEYPFYHAIALWWALLLPCMRWMRRWRSKTTATGATICAAPGCCCASWPSPFPDRHPFMLTALHTAWVVTKYERGGYKRSLRSCSTSSTPWPG